MKLALCIVGCGQFARTFVQGLQPMRDDLDLFFASRDGARARAYAVQFQGCGAFGSYEAAAADPRVEAMYLCTPPPALSIIHILGAEPRASLQLLQCSAIVMERSVPMRDWIEEELAECQMHDARHTKRLAQL